MAARRGQLLLEAHVQGHTVFQAGEHVVVGQAVDVFLRALLLGQVAQDADEKLLPAALVGHLHRRHRDRQREDPAARIAALEHAFVGRGLRQAGQLGAGVAVDPGRHQRAEGQADQVLGRIAEQARGGGVGRDHHAVRIDGEDGVGGVVEDGLEARLAVAQACGAVEHLRLHRGALAAHQQQQGAQQAGEQQAGRQHGPAGHAALAGGIGGGGVESDLVAAAGERQADPVLVGMHAVDIAHQRQHGAAGDVDQRRVEAVEAGARDRLFEQELGVQHEHHRAAGGPVRFAHRTEQADTHLAVHHQAEGRGCDGGARDQRARRHLRASGRGEEVDAAQHRVRGRPGVEHRQVERALAGRMQAPLGRDVLDAGEGGVERAPHPVLVAGAFGPPYRHRPVHALDFRASVDVAAGHAQELVARQDVLGVGEGARKGADEAHVLVELGLQHVGGLLGLQAVGLQVLLVLPAEREAVDRHHRRAGQQQRQADDGRALAPQPARLAAHDPAQGRREQHADGVAGPPAQPVQHMFGLGDRAEREQGRHRNRGADQADQRREQQEGEDVASGIDGGAHAAPELARAQPGLQQGAEHHRGRGHQGVRQRQPRVVEVARQAGEQHAERHAGQHAHAGAGGQGQGHARRREQGQGIAHRQRQGVGNQPRGQVGRDDRQVGQQQRPPTPAGISWLLDVHVIRIDRPLRRTVPQP